MEKPQITVHVKYGNVEQTFTGDVDEVWAGVNRFFSQVIPTFEIAKRLTLTVDLPELVEQLEGIITLAPEGVEILLDRKKVSDRDFLTLCLVGAYVGYRMGLLDADTISRDELQRKLGKTAKITSTRLSELTRLRWVEKVGEDYYRITTLGLKKFLAERVPRLRGLAA